MTFAALHLGEEEIREREPMENRADRGNERKTTYECFCKIVCSGEGLNCDMMSYLYIYMR